MLLYTIIQMIDYLISVVSTIVIVQFVMGLLIAFNVINGGNDVVNDVPNATDTDPELGGGDARVLDLVDEVVDLAANI